ncbi:unnamed protein product [Allacma fusca]|uniref:ATP-dependent helicase C-terminal domain-containing protein n=1 Tax=Allacma fusca TaxID=39272 RepID=A0A8J2KVH9_9HEXA|nr:unnamed protein product [Allacma fusca]
MYSNQMHLSNLKDCFTGLETYIKRYMARFNSKNLLQLKQIKLILKSLLQFLETEPTQAKNLYTIQEFKCVIGIENLDLYSLIKFCEKYRLIFKLKGYMQQQFKLALKTHLEKSEKQMKNNKQTPLTLANSTTSNDSMLPKSNSQSILMFAEFLKSLKTGDCEGRIIIDRAQSSYKFLLLNVSPQFRDLVLSTRSIILAGGTMKPYEEITDHLFAGSAAGRLAHFSCDHVIPQENLVCLTLTKGPTGTAFDFTFKNRSSPSLLEELSQTIQNIIRIVPGGVVCFLPSYDYEALLYKFLQESGAFVKLDTRKKVFREPKDGKCDTVLAEFSRHVRNCSKGALLFAVVGGKLSEGINFSDDLGRCVMVVGLPYPNITSVEIQEKVRYASVSFVSV